MLDPSIARLRRLCLFRPPYVGHRGWLDVWLDVPQDWDEIAAIVESAYQFVAPARLRAILHQGSGGGPGPLGTGPSTT